MKPGMNQREFIRLAAAAYRHIAGLTGRMGEENLNWCVTSGIINTTIQL
jgi:hypothetical protein